MSISGSKATLSTLFCGRNKIIREKLVDDEIDELTGLLAISPLYSPLIQCLPDFLETFP